MNTVTITTIVVACTSARDGVITFFISARTSFRNSLRRAGAVISRSMPVFGAATISAVLAICNASSFVIWYCRENNLAGELGFEPRSSVLETDSLTVELTPPNCAGRYSFRALVLYSLHPIPYTLLYLVSLWSVCLRHVLQNFENSRRPVVVFLFLVVE